MLDASMDAAPSNEPVAQPLRTLGVTLCIGCCYLTILLFEEMAVCYTPPEAERDKFHKVWDYAA